MSKTTQAFEEKPAKEPTPEDEVYPIEYPVTFEREDWGSSTEDEEMAAKDELERECMYGDDYCYDYLPDSDDELPPSDNEDEEEEEDPTAIKDPAFRALPDTVQKKFYDEMFNNRMELTPHKTLMVDKEEGFSYWTVDILHAEKTFEEYVLEEFIPHMPYTKPNLPLRTDYGNRESNYVSSAIAGYRQKYIARAQTETTVYTEDEPFPALHGYKVRYI